MASVTYHADAPEAGGRTGAFGVCFKAQNPVRILYNSIQYISSIGDVAIVHVA